MPGPWRRKGPPCAYCEVTLPMTEFGQVTYDHNRAVQPHPIPHTPDECTRNPMLRVAGRSSNPEQGG